MNRILTRALFSLALLAGVATTASADTAGIPDGRIMVDIHGLRNAKGVVRCSLFASANGFPNEPSRALRSVTAPAIVDGRAACAFDDVKPGVYAVGFLHDENANGKMDTNFLGMPKEGYGASRDARGHLGPPKFDDAKFRHEGRSALRLKAEY